MVVMTTTTMTTTTMITMTMVTMVTTTMMTIMMTYLKEPRRRPLGTRQNVELNSSFL